MTELPRAWKAVFTLEIAICLGTVLYWVVAPGAFLEGVYGAPPGSASHYWLLLQAANVVFCAWVYLYARVLFSKPFDCRAFRWLQEAMAIGDVFVLAASFASRGALHSALSLWAAQVGMAAVWLAIRVAYLAGPARRG